MKKSSTTVLVCSKLPTSLVLNHPMDVETKVTVRGLNAAPRGTNNQPIVVPYMTTEVDADFWAAWEGAHGAKSKKPFPAIKSGALFVADSAANANSISREHEKRATGLEGLSRDKDPRMGADATKVATDKE